MSFIAFSAYEPPKSPDAVAETSALADDGRVKLPGFGLRLQYLPAWDKDATKRQRFPHAIADFVASLGVTVRERRMLDFVTQITDKPEWDRKVFDEEIVAKWKAEAVKHDASLNDEYLSEKMFEVCLAELRDKATFYKETGLVHVMDAEATVVKSDSIVPSSLKEALSSAVKPLENVPEKAKDWHPGSDEMVLDLVHPSLFPLVYGLSRVLPEGKVPLEGCVKYTGRGEIATAASSEDDMFVQRSTAWGNDQTLKAWGNFQWLPSDVEFHDDKAKIVSYINNLHPDKHQELYGVLEQFVDKAIPLWNESLSWFQQRFRFKISYTGSDDWELPPGLKYVRPRRSDDEGEDGENNDEENEDEEDSDLEYDEDYREWKVQHRILIQREPEDYTPFQDTLSRKGAKKIDLKKDFSQSGLQVIFKLANIHLTPEKPTYEGGTWHVEGALNEHICATALYYYDQDNISDCHLGFRQSVDTEELTMLPEQSEYESLEAFYGVQQDGSAIQELGQVLTKEGRLLTFPNILQHRVSKFQLADPTRPGHRKILAMFLVDPHIRIISTANVPPQSRQWWAEEVRKAEGRLGSLPEELFLSTVDQVEDFPISWDDAVAIREKLMEERGMMVNDMNEEMANDTFSFCEH